MDFSERNIVSRYSQRASYDKNNLEKILSKVLFCNVSFCDDNIPFIIPMNFVYLNDKIYLHGSNESRIMIKLAEKIDVTLSFVYVRNVVNAEKLCDFSMDYASAVIFGKSEEVTDDNEKLKFFIELGKKVSPEIYKNVKLPEKSDLEKVKVISIKIEKFSLKSRIGYNF